MPAKESQKAENTPPEKSSRHHYIPRFLIQGFTDKNGLLYVYDKQKDKILKNPKPPKSVFYEWDRNTITKSEKESISILEDHLYSAIDSNMSKVVKYLQEIEIEKFDLSAEDAANFTFFVLTLFWRIPYTDNAAWDVLLRSIISGTSPEEIARIKTDPNFLKMYRAGFFKHSIDQIRKSKKKNNKWGNIHQNRASIYVLGDNPILFNKAPSKFGEVFDLDYLFAVNSRRVYSLSDKKIDSLSDVNSFNYNAMVIEQSLRFICCTDLRLLEESLKYHSILKKKGILNEIPKTIFK